MELQELHKKLEEIKILKQEGKNLEANKLLHIVQKELIAHPVKNPNKNNTDYNIGICFCEKCGKEGGYEEQENLCDFCYLAKNNLNRGNASISQEEMYEENFDDSMKEYQ